MYVYIDAISRPCRGRTWIPRSYRSISGVAVRARPRRGEALCLPRRRPGAADGAGICAFDHERRRRLDTGDALPGMCMPVRISTYVCSEIRVNLIFSVKMERRASYLRRAGLAVDFPLPP
jgi:hypothetical protein